jgi:hypothetical protein
MVQLSGILNRYFRSYLSAPDHSIAGPFDNRTQKVSEKLTIRKPDIRLSDAYCKVAHLEKSRENTASQEMKLRKVYAIS